jgi:hypothetical protein
MRDVSVDNLIKKKKSAKKTFADKYALSDKDALLGIILDHELSGEEEERIKNLLEATRNLSVQVVLLADHQPAIKLHKTELFLEYSRQNRTKLLEAADMALSFSFNDVEEMLLNGTIPITSKREEIANYNPNRETGNGFIYSKDNDWSIFAAIVRATETFRFPYDWNNIVRQGLELKED